MKENHRFSAQHRFALIECLVLTMGVIFFCRLQFTSPHILGPDGYLHVRMADFLRTMGPGYDFHWARFSTFSDLFSDKDLLFHVLYIPFTFAEDIFRGAKYAVCLSFASLFAVMYYLLRKWGPRGLVWMGLFLFMSPMIFLLQLLSPRPHFLIIIFTVLSLHFLIEKRHLLVGVTTALYCLSHVTGPYVLIYAVIAEGARFLSRREISWKNLAAVAGGVMLGYLAHPNFPNNVLQFYLNSVLVPLHASAPGALELGTEFLPLTSRDFLRFFPLMTTGTLAAMAFMMFRPAETSHRTRTVFLTFLCFYVFAFLSKRYLLYSWPLAILFFASYLNDYFSSRPLRSRHLLIALAVVAAATGLWLKQIPSARAYIHQRSLESRHFLEMAEAMRQKIPPGELVFHANWSDSQYFIGLNPANDYLVTLDPIYMYYRSPEHYRLYRAIAGGQVKDAPVLIRERFGARYGYVGRSFGAFYRQVKGDRRFSILAEDDRGALFEIGDIP